MTPIILCAGVCYLFLGAFTLKRPTFSGGSCGVGGSDAHFTQVSQSEATLWLVVSDSRYGHKWEQYWRVIPQTEHGTIRLVASTTGERALFGVRLRTARKLLRTEIPFNQDVSGTKNSFSYEVRWLKKEEAAITAK